MPYLVCPKCAMELENPYGEGAVVVECNGRDGGHVVRTEAGMDVPPPLTMDMPVPAPTLPAAGREASGAAVLPAEEDAPVAKPSAPVSESGVPRRRGRPKREA